MQGESQAIVRANSMETARQPNNAEHKAGVKAEWNHFMETRFFSSLAPYLQPLEALRSRHPESRELFDTLEARVLAAASAANQAAETLFAEVQPEQ